MNLNEAKASVAEAEEYANDERYLAAARAISLALRHYHFDPWERPKDGLRALKWLGLLDHCVEEMSDEGRDRWGPSIVRRDDSDCRLSEGYALRATDLV